MNTKKFVIASLVVGIAAWVLDFLLHGLILADAYKQYAGLFGTMEQMTKWMWLNPIAYWSMSFALGYIFVKGYEGRGVMEGVRFGLLAGVLMSVPRFCFEVMYYNQPKIFDLSNLIGGLITFLVLGILFSLLYKPAAVNAKA